MGPTNRKLRACFAVNSKENSDLFPSPKPPPPPTLCTLNSPHPRDVTSPPSLESFFCQSVGSTRRWRVYGGTTVRRANCFRNGTLAGAKGALRENDSPCRSSMNRPSLPPSFSPFLHFLFFSPPSHPLFYCLTVSSSRLTFLFFLHSHLFNYRPLRFNRATFSHRMQAIFERYRTRCF